ncbi:MAG: Hsp70 family protein [Acidobacteria bacterium]|nr:Hsp70 family protein [Acidobacteriota bacterium]
MNIGIDLGTTNSALAFIDPSESGEADFPPIRILDIPQQVADGRTEARRTLPSFLYLGDQQVVGVYAREQGALVPTRSVNSAKSWLSNADADRTAKILPWDAREGGRVLSPVEVSARILEHIAGAWNHAHPEQPLGAQEVVLTVPASFDEEARELTVEAARAAGLEKLTLLEEPAAAFYSWIANHLSQSQKSLRDGQTVLVCDVGGGTSDFTVIRVSREGDRVDFIRTAVGRHLLLGGDNLDLTLAWLVEAKLGKPLSVRQRSALRRQCAAAKEQLLTDADRKKVEITVLGGGSSLIGGTERTEILRDEALELALEGFVPFCQLSDQPKEEQKSLFRELGLPYVSDPAVTRHLASFLTGAQVGTIDAILFNGGFFIPEILRRRVTEVVGRWYGGRPLVFENQDLDLAVAVGAAYYSYVRHSGSGVLVRGGLPRAYFIGIDGGAGRIRTVCLAPRGTEEGATLDLDLEGLQLVANKPVSFRLYSSLTRTEDKLGDVVEFTPEEIEKSLHMHAPLNAVIRFGKKIEERLIPVTLGARLTEVGTLEIWAQSKVSEQRWRLQFELRKRAEAAPSRPAAVVSEEALVRAEELMDAAFRDSALAPEELPGRLEQAMALGRNSWPLAAIRRLADKLLDCAEGRRRGAAYEGRWLNLAGFCLRPGFGFPGDDLRIEQARRVYAAGLQFASQVQCEIEWWIFWGRLAGGLNRNQQVDLYQRLAQHLLPRGQKKQQRLNASLLREMWRAASSLELLPMQTKTELGEALLQRVKAGDFRESELWCLSRLGARRLFHGPINQVLPAATVSRWVEALAKANGAAEAIAAMAARTGDAARDLSEAALALARKSIAGNEAALAVLEGETGRDLAALGRVFGEELPSGLVITAES